MCDRRASFFVLVRGGISFEVIGSRLIFRKAKVSMIRQLWALVFLILQFEIKCILR